MENFEIHDVKINDEIFSNGMNLEEKLFQRFSEAEKVFGFVTEKEINCWDFLSINGNPEKLRNLQNQMTNCKTEKINIQMDNTQNRD